MAASLKPRANLTLIGNPPLPRQSKKKKTLNHVYGELIEITLDQFEALAGKSADQILLTVTNEAEWRYHQDLQEQD